MRKTIIALTAIATLSAGASQAQVALKPGTPSLLVWSPQQQSEGYRSIETIYKVGTIKRGRKVHPDSARRRQ